MVLAKLNVLITGASGAGKTTLLNTLLQFVPEDERLVIIEETAELKLFSEKNWVSFETRYAGPEGDGEIDVRTMFAHSLRLRPDRIIVGEVRGAEAFDMIQAMSTGHDGSFCTIHARSPEEVPFRLMGLISQSSLSMSKQALFQQIGSNIDIVIFLQKDPDGIRRVKRISEFHQDRDTLFVKDIFKFDVKQQEFIVENKNPFFLEKITDHSAANKILRILNGDRVI